LTKKYLKLFFAFLAIVLLGYLYFRFDSLDILFPKCPLYATTGIYCPGCGSQRATHSLLHFDVVGAFRSNVLFIPAIILVGYHYAIRLINIFLDKKYHSALDHPKAPYIVLVIVLLYFILRNIPVEPFTYLTP
jgi:hypothetical protein